MTTVLKEPVPAPALHYTEPMPRRPRSLGASLYRASPWYLMILPGIALVVWLIVIPFVRSVILGFQEVRFGATDVEWVGFENYARLFSDPELAQAFLTTFTFAVASVAIQLVLAWSLALLLWNMAQRTGTVVRVLFTIPMLLSPVAVGIVWSVLLNPQYGWLTAGLGFTEFSVLGSPVSALITLILVETWQWTPFMFLIIAAGLNAIPEDTLEAARLDGAGPVRLFRSIIWPLTLPVTLVAILFRGLDTLKSFDLPYNLTGGGPGTSTQTIAIYLYKQAFTRFDQGYASAIALATTIVLAAVGLIILAFMGRAERAIA